jgi:hypothetical protein
MSNEMEIELDFILNYAVSITDRLVSLYRCHDSKWIFVRNATLSDGIQICKLEKIYYPDNKLLAAFPFALDPNKITAYQQKISQAIFE